MTTVLNTLLLIKSIHHYLILFANTAERLNMIEGISKEELVRIKETMPDGQSKLFIHLLIKKCTELDPWLPIDENTPKDRPIWLWNGVKHLAARWNERNNDWWIAISFGDSKEPFTHYKLLPEDPKE